MLLCIVLVPYAVWIVAQVFLLNWQRVYINTEVNVFASAHHSLSSLSQVKELKSRVADMEGQPRSTAGVTILESKIQELEDRLLSEERYTHTHTHQPKCLCPGEQYVSLCILYTGHDFYSFKMI